MLLDCNTLGLGDEEITRIDVHPGVTIDLSAKEPGTVSTLFLEVSPRVRCSARR
jgi:hypothetical protein